MLNDVRRVEIRLYGSLSATGVGHATDRATVMGLMGEWPDSIDPTTIDARIEQLRDTGQLSLAGERTLPSTGNAISCCWTKACPTTPTPCR